MTAWLNKLYETFIETGYYALLFEGLGNTLVITLGALAIGVVIGVLIAVIKYFAEDSPALKPLALLCDLYTTAIRGIPVVVLLLIFYFIILSSADGITVGILTFGINSGAYMAELIRSGINAVDKGQMEAARSLGLNYTQATWRVILPQTIKNVFPSLGNELIVLLKETSISGYIALQDLTKAGDIVRSRTYSAFFPYISVAAIYLVLVLILEKILGNIEGRLAASDR